MATSRTAAQDQSVTCPSTDRSYSTAGPGGFQRRDECWAHDSHDRPDSIPPHRDTCAAVAGQPQAPTRARPCAALPAPPAPAGGTMAAEHHRGGGGTLARRRSKSPTGPAASPRGTVPRRARRRLGRRQPPAGEPELALSYAAASHPLTAGREGPRTPRSAVKERARYRPHAAAAPRPLTAPPSATAAQRTYLRREGGGSGGSAPGPGVGARSSAPPARRRRRPPRPSAIPAAAPRSSVPPPAPAAAARGLSVRRRHFVGVSAAEGFPDMGSSRPAPRARRSPRRPDPDAARRPPTAPARGEARAAGPGPCPGQGGGNRRIQRPPSSAARFQVLLFPSAAVPSSTDK